MSTVKEEAIKLRKNIDDVYKAGIQSEYDRFWDSFQQKGLAYISYANAFDYDRWTDEIFNPKYPIKPSDCNNMFMRSALTDTKVDIDLTCSIMTQAFYLFESSKLITIRKLIVPINRSYTRYFNGCNSLRNITFEGEIGRSIDFSYSPLTVESMKSVITHLANYTGTDKEGTYTVTFNGACWEALEADSTAPDGSTWKLYVDSLGWLT